MDLIRKKLKSRAGVTIVFALIAFIVATLVSVTIISVSLNNIMRVKGQQQAQKSLLSATSAASLMREKLSDQGVRITQDFEDEACTVAYKGLGPVVKNINDVEGEPEKPVNKLAETLALAMLPDPDAPDDDGTYDSTMTLSVTDGPSVNVKVKYTGDQVEMRFEEDGKTAAMCLVFDGAAARELSKVPFYDWVDTGEVDESGNPIYGWQIIYYTRTLEVKFDAENIYAKAEKLTEAPEP